MGNVVVGYVAKPEGQAALTSAISEAKLRGAKVIVVNSHRGGQDFDRAASHKVDSEMESVRSRLDSSCQLWAICESFSSCLRPWWAQKSSSPLATTTRM